MRSYSNFLSSSPFIADLPGATLGEEIGNIIIIDTNAAGYGWFIDMTPSDNKEFKASSINGELTAMASSPASIPVSSGENVARLLKRLSAELRVIILSVHDEPLVVQECLAAGAKGFVLKRAAVDDLIPAVEAVLKGDTYVSPAIQPKQEKASGQATKSGEEAQ